MDILHGTLAILLFFVPLAIVLLLLRVFAFYSLDIAILFHNEFYFPNHSDSISLSKLTEAEQIERNSTRQICEVINGVLIPATSSASSDIVLGIGFLERLLCDGILDERNKSDPEVYRRR